MQKVDARWLFASAMLAVVVALEWQPPQVESACCYFSAKEKDILQPSQKVFITWDPKAKVESFTVQPRFEGNASDFGMVVPTPSRPELHEMPRDFFKEMAVFTILKQRQFPQSRLMPLGGFGAAGGAGFGGGLGFAGGGFGALGGLGAAGGMPASTPRPPAVKVVETGVVGSLDYKILRAGRADDLYQWLKDNKYRYSGDEAALDFYIKKKWYFTVMKIDTMQMKRNADGSFTGDVTPTHFQFTSEELVYPLKITQLSVRDKTEALLYIQAPFKADLPGDFTYQYQWTPLLKGAQGCTRGKLPGNGDAWLLAAKDEIPALLDRAKAQDFTFTNGQRSEPNKQGRTPTTLEWAKRLTAEDIQVLKGLTPFTEKVPNVDAGMDATDFRNVRTAAFLQRVIQNRLDKCRRERPEGYLVRAAPALDVRGLRLLVGHLKEGQFLTKLRKTFTRTEMDEDLLIIPAALGTVQDQSEYEESLPTSPP